MISTINMVLQIAIFGALTWGIFYVNRRRIIPHGYLMLAAVSFNLISILLVMMPSAIRVLSGGVLNAFILSVAVHSVIGLIVEATGMYVVYKWRFQRPGISCLKQRNLMRPLRLFWAASMALGVVIYLMIM